MRKFALAMAIGGAALWAVWIGVLRPPSPVPDSQPAGRSDAVLSDSMGADLDGDAVLLERSATPSWIRVVDSTRRPLTTATLTWSVAGEAPDTLLTEPVIRADDEGVLRTEGLSEEGMLGIVRAPGHVPHVVKDPPHGAEVQLRPAASLRIAIVDPLSRLVPDATIVLTTDGATSDFLGIDPPPNGIGHPLARRPRWSGTSDGNGQVMFDELPAGKYFMNVLHPWWLPLQEWGANSPIVLSANVHHVTVAVEEMFGVAFEVPETVSITESHFHAGFASLNVLPHVTSRIPLAREWLAARHPRGQVYVHRPLRPDRNEVLVRCQVRTSDGSRWLGEGPLRPLRDVTAPIFLERDDRPTRDITILLADSLGNRFNALPLLLSGAPGSIHAATGERVSVPHGAYEVTPLTASAPMWGMFRDMEIRVDDGSPDQFVVTAEEPIAEIVVRPRLPSPIVRGPLTVMFYNERKQGPAVANWVPERGPIRQLLHARQISVQVHSLAYKDVDVPLRDVVYGRPNEIDIDLEERNPK